MKKILIMIIPLLLLISCNYQNKTHIYLGDILDRNEINDLKTKNEMLFSDEMVSNDELLKFKPKVQNAANDLIGNNTEVSVSNNELWISTKIPILNSDENIDNGFASIYVNQKNTVSFGMNKNFKKIADDRASDINFQLGFDDGSFTFQIINDLRNPVKTILLVDAFVDGDAKYANTIIKFNGRESHTISVSNVSDYLINQGKRIDFFKILN